MANVFELFAKLSLDGKGYDKSLGDALSKTKAFASKVGSAIKVATAAVTAAGAAVGTAVGALTKQSLDAYADYEQLVGGVETLFKSSAKLVQQYADEAYKTAGLSANEYMETVTSFSASLLQSLGGDTKKAAEYADMAIRDMSDNANKMGSDMSAIQVAYQGFAKQNYTMLDNLKLGYGGTKTEMERLIEDAEKLDSTFKASRDETGALAMSYADVVDAIHIVQTEMGITGTTAKEASETISGSVASMKSAWSNLVTELGKKNGDISGKTKALADSIVTVMRNIVPRIEVIFENIPKLVESAISEVSNVLWDISPRLGSSFDEAVENIRSKFQSIIDYVQNKIVPAFQEAWPTIQNIVTNVFQIIERVWESVLRPAFEKLGDFVLKTLLPAIEKVSAFVLDNIDSIMRLASTIAAVVAVYEGWQIAQALINTLMNANPIGLLITAIGGLIAVGIELYHTFTDDADAVKAVIDAENDLITAHENLNNALSNNVTAIDRAEQAEQRLKEAEEAVGVSGEYLAQMVENGLIQYQYMTEEQKELYKAYINNQQAQDVLTESTQRLEEAKQAEIEASQDLAIATADEQGNLEEYARSLIESFENGEITAEEARQGIEKAMTGMSLSAEKAFLEDIPEALRDGLDPTRYETQANLVQKGFDELWSYLTTGSQDASGNIHTAWSDLASWFQTSVVDPIWSAFQNLWNSISSNPLFNFLAGLLGQGGAVSAINNITSAFNSASGSVPVMAGGGILRRGEIGLLEGDGAEAVVPLDQNQKWIHAVASDMVASLKDVGAGGGASNSIQINVYGTEGQSEATLAEEIDRVLWDHLNQKDMVYA